jgi:hypothetical protein
MRQWVNGDRTVLVTEFPSGSMHVATRETPDHIWSPPTVVVEEGHAPADAPESPLVRAAAELERLRNGLALIVKESEQFSHQDGIGAGAMARNLLAGAGR